MKHKRTTRRRGFSLIEAILSIVILLMISTVTAGLYGSSVWIARQRADEGDIVRLMRDQMEKLIATKFSAATSGSQAVTVGGASQTLAWTLTAIDLDGDGHNEPGVFRCQVTLAQRSISTIVFNTTGIVGKIS